jgi:hypothetical protein
MWNAKITKCDGSLFRCDGLERPDFAAMIDELKKIGSALESESDPRFSDYLMKQRVVEIAEVLGRSSSAEK